MRAWDWGVFQSFPQIEYLSLWFVHAKLTAKLIIRYMSNRHSDFVLVPRHETVVSAPHNEDKPRLCNLLHLAAVPLHLRHDIYTMIQL